MDETHSVDWVTRGITWRSASSWSGFTICFLYLIGTLCLACWAGCMLGSVKMVYVPGMLPIVSEDRGGSS